VRDSAVIIYENLMQFLRDKQTEHSDTNANIRTRMCPVAVVEDWHITALVRTDGRTVRIAGSGSIKELYTACGRTFGQRQWGLLASPQQKVDVQKIRYGLFLLSPAYKVLCFFLGTHTIFFSMPRGDTRQVQLMTYKNEKCN